MSCSAGTKRRTSFAASSARGGSPGAITLGGLVLLLAAVPGCTTAGVAAAAGPKPWVNSTEGIHLFLTFDYDLNASQIKAVGKRYDYVWGSSQSTHHPNETSFWREGNPAAVISWYITYNRDPHPLKLSWYEQNHPTVSAHRV